MKAAFLSLCICAASLAGTPTPELKTLSMPTVNFDTVPQPTRNEPVSPLTGQNLPPAQRIEQKNVDTSTLQFSTVPTHVVPQQNFSAKRATVAGSVAVPADVKTDRADIEKRVIRPQGRKGAEELKEQLNHPQ